MFIVQTAKKLTSILMTPILMTVASIEVIFTVTPTTKNLVESFEALTPITNTCLLLEYMLYIYYLFRFWKNKKSDVKAFINSNSEVNVITLTYVKKLGFQIQKTVIGVQKIDKSS